VRIVVCKKWSIFWQYSWTLGRLYFIRSFYFWMCSIFNCLHKLIYLLSKRWLNVTLFILPRNWQSGCQPSSALCTRSLSKKEYSTFESFYSLKFVLSICRVNEDNEDERDVLIGQNKSARHLSALLIGQNKSFFLSIYLQPIQCTACTFHNFFFLQQH
jgi:hypothetical protein